MTTQHINRPAPASDEAGSLIRFVENLHNRYAECTAGDPPPSDWLARVSALTLGLAALRDAFASSAPGSRPLQLGVIGPTQVGKSTLVNLLLGETAARVSPLAGFTAHAQGFSCGHVPDPDWSAGLFPGWQRGEVEALDANQPGRFVLRDTDSRLHEQLACEAVVVWDTPDFDSTRARAHQRAVLEVVALADVLVLALSKEKYSDLSVWELLRLIAPLERPLVVCLNKMPTDGADVIAGALRTKLEAAGGTIAAAPVVMMPYVAGVDANPADLTASVEHLRAGITGLLGESARCARPAHALVLVRRHWDPWCEPVLAEQSVHAAWRALVDRAVEQAIASYTRDYQDHPQRFDTFRRAIAELLRLLELPGVANAFSRAREWVTWPARQLYAARLRWSRRRHGPNVTHGAGSEEIVLRDAVAKLLVQLARDAARRAKTNEPGWRLWSAISDRLESHEADLTQRAHETIARFRQAFEPEIQQAAQNLYNELQQHPTVLNTLRAARVTADAAALVLAVKTAGVGVETLLLAPAVLSVTSMLTEGALGSYMQTVAANLKRRQMECLRQQVFVEALQAELLALPDDLRGQGVFGISRVRMDAAADALAKLERGDA